MANKRLFLVGLFAAVIAGAAGGIFFLRYIQRAEKALPSAQEPAAITPTPTASPTATPTPRPLTFAEMNERFGPCTTTPTLMYHHIEPLDVAKAANHLYLTVSPETFAAQMAFLAAKNYQPVTMTQLVAFFDQGQPLPPKSVLLTFDDGYADFHQYAYPVLQQYQFHATMFLPTGLITNPDYLNWDQISQMNGSGLVMFANHTWSHKSTSAGTEIARKEIGTADTQLSEHGLAQTKVFASPNGSPTSIVASILAELNYKLAFLTTPGRVLCAKQRFGLPRVRIGDTPLSRYGF